MCLNLYTVTIYKNFGESMVKKNKLLENERRGKMKNIYDNNEAVIY